MRRRGTGALLAAAVLSQHNLSIRNRFTRHVHGKTKHLLVVGRKFASCYLLELLPHSSGLSFFV
jgi:hypothetical protein